MYACDVKLLYPWMENIVATTPLALRWYAVHHERNVREEQHHIYVARSSNHRVILLGELYSIVACWLLVLPQCEALRKCRSGFQNATKCCCDLWCSAVVLWPVSSVLWPVSFALWCSGVQDLDFRVQSGRIFGFFSFGLDIIFLSTGFGSGLSKWNKIWQCKNLGME